MLPKEFPDWDNVYKTFRRWHRDGLLEQCHDRVLAYWRSQMSRHVSPSTAAIDSQSTRHSPQGSQAGGVRRQQKIKGRKRHVVVESMGLLLAVAVSSASMTDRDALDSTVAAAIDK